MQLTPFLVVLCLCALLIGCTGLICQAIDRLSAAVREGDAGGDEFDDEDDYNQP